MLTNNINFFKYQPVDTGEDLQSYATLIENKVQQHDKNYQAASILEDKLSELKAKSSKQDAVYVDGVINKIKDNFSNVANTISGNKRWDLAGRVVEDNTMSVIKDVNLKGIQESYKNYQEKLDAENKMRASGHTPIDLGDDFENHRSFNSDGSLNIYKHKVQPMADYEGEKLKLVKQIEAEVLSSPLVPAEFGMLRTSKIKELTEEKMREKLPSLLRTYNNLDTGIQEKQVLRKQYKNLSDEDFEKVYNNKVSEDFGSLANILEYKAEQTDYMQNPLEASDRAYERAMRLQELKNKGRGYNTNDASVQMRKGGVETFGNNDGAIEYHTIGAELQKVLKTNIGGNHSVKDLIPSGGYNLNGYEEGVIKDYSITGVNTRNSTFNKNLNGAIKVRATVLDASGKNPKIIEGYLPNPDAEARRQFGILNRFENIAKNAKDNTASFIHDTEDKQILAIDNPSINPNIIYNENIGLMVNKNKNQQTIIPTIKDGGKYRQMTKDEATELGLKMSYNPSKLADVITERYGESLRSQVKTPKQTSESDVSVDNNDY